MGAVASWKAATRIVRGRAAGIVTPEARPVRGSSGFPGYRAGRIESSSPVIRPKVVNDSCTAARSLRAKTRVIKNVADRRVPCCVRGRLALMVIAVRPTSSS